MQGQNLSFLWGMPAPPRAVGKSAGGRMTKSRKTMVVDAAAAIIAAATPAANAAVAAASLGACLVSRGIGGKEARLRKQFTTATAPGGPRHQWAAMAYHVTWCAERDSPPPGVPGLE